jgi:hypothetical protein
MSYQKSNRDSYDDPDSWLTDSPCGSWALAGAGGDKTNIKKQDPIFAKLKGKNGRCPYFLFLI